MPLPGVYGPDQGRRKPHGGRTKGIGATRMDGIHVPGRSRNVLFQLMRRSVNPPYGIGAGGGVARSLIRRAELWNDRPVLFGGNRFRGRRGGRSRRQRGGSSGQLPTTVGQPPTTLVGFRDMQHNYPAHSRWQVRRAGSNKRTSHRGNPYPVGVRRCGYNIPPLGRPAARVPTSPNAVMALLHPQEKTKTQSEPRAWRVRGGNTTIFPLMQAISVARVGKLAIVKRERVSLEGR